MPLRWPGRCRSRQNRRFDASAATGFDVGVGISQHDCIAGGPLDERAAQHAGVGFAVGVIVVSELRDGAFAVMRAEIECIDVCAMHPQRVLQVSMKAVHVCFCV